MALPTLPMLGWDKGALCTHLGGNRRGSSIPRAGQTPPSPSSVCPPLNPSDVHIAQPLWCWRSPEPPQYFHPLDPSHVHIPPNLSSVHIPKSLWHLHSGWGAAQWGWQRVTSLP